MTLKTIVFNILLILLLIITVFAYWTMQFGTGTDRTKMSEPYYSEKGYFWIDHYPDFQTDFKLYFNFSSYPIIENQTYNYSLILNHIQSSFYSSDRDYFAYCNDYSFRQTCHNYMLIDFTKYQSIDGYFRVEFYVNNLLIDNLTHQMITFLCAC